MIRKGYTAILSARIDFPKQYLNNTYLRGVLGRIGPQAQFGRGGKAFGLALPRGHDALVDRGGGFSSELVVNRWQ